MAEKRIWERLKNNQISRFVISAGMGFLVDVFAFYLFFNNLFDQKTYRILSTTVGNYTLSLSISFFLGVIVNFLMTRYIVFSKSKLPAYKQFIRFMAVAVIGFFANLIVLKLLIRFLHLYPPVARIVAALSLFFGSYFVHKVFSFSLSLRHHEHHSDHPADS